VPSPGNEPGAHRPGRAAALIPFPLMSLQPTVIKLFALARRLGGGARRVRVAMYTAFAVLAVAILAQSFSTLRLEDLRKADGQAQDLAGQQRTLSQQAGRAAAMMAAEPHARSTHAHTLQGLLRRSHEEATKLDQALERHVWRTEEAKDLQPAVDAWAQARERLWLRAERLQLLSEGADKLTVTYLAGAVQAETESTMEAAHNLSAVLSETAEKRANALHAQVRWGLAGLFALLLVLGATVVEPTARSVQRHTLRLREQATEVRRLALVAEHTAALVLITDTQDRLVWANAAFLKHAGASLEQVRGRLPNDVFPGPPAQPEAIHLREQAQRNGHGIRQEWLKTSCDGSEIWVDVDLCPLRGDDGELEGFVRVCTDITARVHQHAKQQALWAALPAGVVVHNAAGEVVEVNRAAERLLDMTAAQLMGRNSLDPRWSVVREDGSAYGHAEHPTARTLATGLALNSQTVGFRLRQGDMRWLLINTQPQRDALGHVNGVVSCFTDISESRSLQARLIDSARTDALTGLPNRTVVMERLQRAIAHAQRFKAYGFAVLFMDFDRFKQVNDTLGHGAGDELLRQIAQRLERSLRPGDAVARLGTPDETQTAARLGGDEFVVVLEGVRSGPTVQAVAERLLQELSEPYLVGSTPVQSSVSIGVVMCPDSAGVAPPATAEEVLRNADTAMYEAKRAGRGRWVMFDDSMQQRVVRALEVETDLRQALKDDELFVVYQPVMNLATRRMAGVEALVRWRHPRRGLVNPVEFIGVAEECGLIDAVGAVVLNKACTQFMQWQTSLGALAPTQLAVNLSRAQLDRAALVSDVADVLQSTGMQPQALQLEVTESLAAQDERVLSMLRQLKALGVRLALDDFGTGYSSLACLHQMPVDTVKVDRSFVQHAEGADYHRVLIEATIRVARTLGMSTVAEGIETQGQADLMQQLECDYGQGYLFAKPLEAAQLQRWALAQARAAAPPELAQQA
jgi:diguanylate cyclase (GGDEF)-like protein/PAS domain S-box-containing protein